MFLPATNLKTRSLKIEMSGSTSWSQTKPFGHLHREGTHFLELRPRFPDVHLRSGNILTQPPPLAPNKSCRAANRGSKPFVVCNCNFRLMADYRPDWASALQKAREGRREQHPDLYDCSTCSGLEGEEARASEAWPAV